MNISLFSVEKVVFGRFLCSPEPAQGTRAVPVDGSVLSLSGIPPVIWGDAIHLHMPCFALEGVQGALDQGEGSGELKSISAGLVWVTGTQSPGSSPVQLGLSAPS